MMTDPIADMLTRIRNASAARHEQVDIPFSKLKFNIAKILERANYIIDVSETIKAGQRQLVINLKYSDDGKAAISHLQRVSRPGKRVYEKKNELPRVLNGYGIAIVSTPAGLMTNKEASHRGLGGEIICEIY